MGDLASEPRRNSVSALIELYSVVIAIALSYAIFNQINTESVWRESGIFKNTGSLWNLLTFLAVLIPFYHGAVRHLQIRYLENAPGTKIYSFTLFISFLLLFAEGIFFIAFGAALGTFSNVIIAAFALITLDVVWGLFVLATPGDKRDKRETAAVLSWIILNVVTAFALGVVIFLSPSAWVAWPPEVQLFVFMLTRTVFDYAVSWRFYFPLERVAQKEPTP